MSDEASNISWCSFCHRGNLTVDILVEDRTRRQSGICSDCVQQCVEIIAEYKAASGGSNEH
jgi:ClpX C4-type zinc finger